MDILSWIFEATPKVSSFAADCAATGLSGAAFSERFPGVNSTLLNRTPEAPAVFSIWETSVNTLLSEGSNCSAATNCPSSSKLSRLPNLSAFWVRLKALVVKSLFAVRSRSTSLNFGQTTNIKIKTEITSAPTGAAKLVSLVSWALFSDFKIAIVGNCMLF